MCVWLRDCVHMCVCACVCVCSQMRLSKVIWARNFMAFVDKV